MSQITVDVSTRFFPGKQKPMNQGSTDRAVFTTGANREIGEIWEVGNLSGGSGWSAKKTTLILTAALGGASAVSIVLAQFSAGP